MGSCGIWDGHGGLELHVDCGGGLQMGGVHGWRCGWCAGCVWAMCGLCAGSNKMMKVNGDATGEWLVKIGSFGTEVGWCSSGGIGEGSSERNGFSGY